MHGRLGAFQNGQNIAAFCLQQKAAIMKMGAWGGCKNFISFSRTQPIIVGIEAFACFFA